MQGGEPIKAELECILDRHDPLDRGYLVQQRSHQRGLAGPGAASDHDVPPCQHRRPEELDEGAVHHSPLLQLGKARQLKAVPTDNDGGALGHGHHCEEA